LTTTSTNSRKLGEYISQAEAARIVGTSRQTIAYRVSRGYFTTKVVGGLALLLRSEAEASAASYKNNPAGKKSQKRKLRTAERASEDMSRGYISQAEAARIRGVSKQAIADLINRGRLTGAKVAGRTLVLRSEVEAFQAQPELGRPRKKRPSATKSKKKSS
jgi:predicted DNA-binding protein (UPF0251 family)